MSESRKKVEITLGSFACSVEGYDNPVEPMREILLMMRDIVGDAPALSGRDGIGATTLARIESALGESAGKFVENGPRTITIRAIEDEEAAISEASAAHSSIFAQPQATLSMLPEGAHIANIFTAPAEIGAHGDAVTPANLFAAPKTLWR